MHANAVDVERPVDARALADSVIQTDLIALAMSRDGAVLFANSGFRALFGDAKQLVGVRIPDLVVEPHRKRLEDALGTAMRTPTECVARVARTDGSTFDVELRFGPVAHNGEALVAICARDVTESYRASAQLNLLAYSDPLTGLANRALFADQLRQAVLNARRATQAFGLLALDLDGFKAVNDQHGHDAGDIALQQIAQKFAACLRDSDTIARLGGDEFAILLPNLKDTANAAMVAERLIEAAKQPISLGEQTVRLNTSVGIALYPEHASAVEHLRAAADTALYAAKRQGRGRYAYASPEIAMDHAAAPIAWNATHEVGIRQIDQQHVRLISLLNELACILQNGADHTTHLRTIIRYTEFHFASEERLMAEFGCDGATEHRDSHRRLLNDIGNLGLEREGFSVGLTLRYLQEWMLRHVDGPDRDLGQALLKLGVR
jgi:diguanylate cyclase (GGDEF)-like protein/hemerythrin-like metal-binding protein/PAS domain S-box-containing protein